MRDGTELAADLYLPSDKDGCNTTFPVILERTPYNKSGISRSESSFRNPSPMTRAQVAEFFAHNGFAVVMQDCRGRYESGGNFHKYIHEAEDGFDTVEWLREQDWSDGRIGTMGLSYGAHVQCALAALNPPGLTCMFIDSGGFSNAFQSGIRQGGAFELKQVTWALRHALLSSKTAADPDRKRRLETVDIASWFRKLGWSEGNSPLSAAPEYEHYVFEQWQNGTFSDYWRQPALFAEGHYESFPDIPVAIIGSWYDPYAAAAVAHFSELGRLKQSPVRLLMGPWTHGDRSQSWAGRVDFGPRAVLDGNIAEDYLNLRLAWFDRFLRRTENAQQPLVAPVTYFRMGGGSGKRLSNGHLDHGGEWRNAMEWPPNRCKPLDLFLTENGTLSKDQRTANEAHQILYDPENPVPTIGGAVTSGQPVMAGGAFDQVLEPSTFSMQPISAESDLSSRDDVLSFESSPLENDVEISGPVEVELYVSSSRSDTDFTIKLLDVYPASADLPNGFAMNLTDSIFRMRYREGWDSECMMKFGEIYRINIVAADTSNLFLAGHRIRLDISCSNYPRFDVNPNTGKPSGDLSDPVVAENIVRSGPDYPSKVILQARHC